MSCKSWDWQFWLPELELEVYLIGFDCRPLSLTLSSFTAWISTWLAMAPDDWHDLTVRSGREFSSARTWSAEPEVCSSCRTSHENNGNDIISIAVNSLWVGACDFVWKHQKHCSPMAGCAGCHHVIPFGHAIIRSTEDAPSPRSGGLEKDASRVAVSDGCSSSMATVPISTLAWYKHIIILWCKGW